MSCKRIKYCPRVKYRWRIRTKYVFSSFSSVIFSYSTATIPAIHLVIHYNEHHRADYPNITYLFDDFLFYIVHTNIVTSFHQMLKIPRVAIYIIHHITIRLLFSIELFLYSNVTKKDLLTKKQTKTKLLQYNFIKMGIGGEKRITYKSHFNHHYSNYTIRYMYYSSLKKCMELHF